MPCGNVRRSSESDEGERLLALPIEYLQRSKRAEGMPSLRQQCLGSAGLTYLFLHGQESRLPCLRWCLCLQTRIRVLWWALRKANRWKQRSWLPGVGKFFAIPSHFCFINSYVAATEMPKWEVQNSFRLFIGRRSLWDWQSPQQLKPSLRKSDRVRKAECQRVLRPRRRNIQHQLWYLRV